MTSMERRTNVGTAMVSRREFLERAAVGVMTAPGFLHATTSSGQRTLIQGTVNTVLGPIDAARLGVTLPHEHICASSAGFWQAWPDFFGGHKAFIERVVEKLKAAKQEGLDSIVDVTTIDTGRDIRLIEEVSRVSGVQVVASTGHWLEPTRSMSARSVDELTSFFRREIEEGIEGTRIRAGVIKVATDREGVTPFIEKALRAAARASRATGTPITTHSYSPDRMGEKQAQIFESEGVDPATVCIGHSDDTDDLEYVTGLARRGYTIGMDHLPQGLRGPVTWQSRAARIKQLIDAGFVNRIFLSNDWYFGLSIAATGAMQTMDALNPDGMLFVTRKAIPHLRELGVAESAIRTMTVENPRNFFGTPRA